MNRIIAINYLRQHQDLLNKATDKEIVQALKDAGIVSRSTYWRDCDVALLVRKASRLCAKCGSRLGRQESS
jgi:ACT domain-containing protein